MQSSRSLVAKVGAAVLALAAAGTASVAEAGDRVHFSIGAHVAPGVVLSASNAPYYYYGPRYVVPAPVYYYAPPPVYYAPPPVYYRPATVIVGGHPYWRHGHRHWHKRHHRHRHW